ncbi:MAG: restriction endonuclease [Alphaproteobacteria bacterium]|nr:restriction endonuclease [Alphaproteobacteria bacterium]MBU1277672.1 restriction endonuclease [Alphaproteobacteria bacterium]MBU1572016.1 restriction endonuclease [Alphaproteobacteria bacterium]MBU1828114.1 restriction endonuclease [Alphaproteobacteria bacterium]MBU2078137.1 restriction endonuclease [Alphaproteobacteria bacterium]
MSRMKDLQIEVNQEQAAIFEKWIQLVESLLKKAKFSEIREFPQPDDYDEDAWKMRSSLPDIEANSEMGHRIAVELKIYRWRSDWKNHAPKAVQHLQSIVGVQNYHSGILVITWERERILRESAELKVPTGIEIWDLHKLRSLAQDDPITERELSDLIDETVMHADDIEWPTAPAASPPYEEKDGAALARKLRSTVPGKAGWKEFEDLCEDAFKLLFGKQISSWKRQNRTDDGLNRMDIIGRIQTSDESFWSDIARDFRARYVVFEAKNYKKPIKQGQVLTTEKYLFTKALRPVAIVVARTGMSDSADKTTRGSLREQGKLILTINLPELCSLLEGLDHGESPENLLFLKLDQMLMSIGR